MRTRKHGAETPGKGAMMYQKEGWRLPTELSEVNFNAAAIDVESSRSSSRPPKCTSHLGIGLTVEQNIAGLQLKIRNIRSNHMGI